MIDACVMVETCDRCQGTGDDGGFLSCQKCSGTRIATLVRPLDERARALLARDPEGVSRAEQHGRELIDRLARMKAAPPDHLAWRVVDWTSFRASGFNTFFQGLERIARAAHAGAKLHAETPAILEEFGLSWGDCTTDPMAQHAIAALYWKSAVLHDLVVPDDSTVQGASVPSALRGHRFKDALDPFDPLLEIWRAGYAVGGEVDNHLVLVVRDQSY
jgi:hypothetical protein